MCVYFLSYGGECSEEPKTPLGRSGGECENWDLCLVVDPVMQDQEAAQAEVESFFRLLRKEDADGRERNPLQPGVCQYLESFQPVP